MKSFFLLALFVTLFSGDWAQEVYEFQGSVSIQTINSQALGYQREIQVYLPPGYDETDRSYPVAYFLHGFIGDHTAFAYINEVVDRLIVAGEIEPIIVIKPNGAIRGSLPPIGSLWANSIVNGNYEDFLLNEVIPWTDNNYRSLANRQNRLLMGHSFGASGAVRLVFENLNTFGSVASHSGFATVNRWLIETYVNTSVFVENNGQPVDPSAGLGQIYTLFIFTGAKAWSPDFSEPFNVSLPMVNNGSGIIIPEVVSQWEAFSPHIILPEKLTELRTRPLGLLYVDIGNKDELLLLQPNMDFAAQLLNENLPHVMRIYDGPHNNETLLRLRFRESITEWDTYLHSLRVAQPEESKFPYGLVFGLIFGIVFFVLLVILLIVLAVKKKWHVVFLEKKIADGDDSDSFE